MGLGRALGWLAGLVGAAALGLAALLRTIVWLPDDVEEVTPVCAPEAPPLPRDRPLKVLVWNVQYAGSRAHWFFYDGGQDVHVPASVVPATLDRIAEVIRAADADLVLLQEIDRDSARTGRVDEHAELLARLDFPCHVSTPYHRVAYVPHPSHRHLGKVDMHLSVFSRYRLDAATRTALPLMVEPWWRQLFNLRRALLEVSLPVDGGGHLRLFTTHLSAFSRGDGTLDRQMAVLDEATTRAELAGDWWLLGGDLNALPPGDDPTRLGAAGLEYTEPVSPVTRLFERHASVIPAAQYQREPERFRTYLPYGATAPDRTLDYVFTGRKVGVVSARVLQELDVSDHLPLLVELTLE